MKKSQPIDTVPTAAFSMVERRKKVKQLNKEIITPEQKAERLFLLIETLIVEQYEWFTQLPPYEELYKHAELPVIITDTIKQLYEYIYADHHLTHGMIKELTDHLLSDLI